MLDKASLAELEMRFESPKVGHVNGDAPKLPFYAPVPDGPGRAHLDGGRSHYDPRVVPGETW